MSVKLQLAKLQARLFRASPYNRLSSFSWVIGNNSAAASRKALCLVFPSTRCKPLVSLPYSWITFGRSCILKISWLGHFLRTDGKLSIDDQRPYLHN